MNAFQIFLLSIAIQSCYSHIIRAKNQEKRMAQKGALRQLETFTTLILDNEPYSIFSVAKHPKTPVKTMGKSSHRLKDNLGKQRHTTKDAKSKLEGIPPVTHARNNSNHKKEMLQMLKKGMRKHHFKGHEKKYRKTRQQHDLLQNYKFPLPSSVTNTTYNSKDDEAKKAWGAPSISDQRLNTVNSINLMQNSGQNPWVKSDYPALKTSRYEYFYRNSTPSGLVSSNSRRDIFPSHSDNRDSWFHENNALGSNGNNSGSSNVYVNPYVGNSTMFRTSTTVYPYFKTTVPSIKSTRVPPSVTTIVSSSIPPTIHSITERVAIVPRNLQDTPHQRKVEKSEQEEVLREDDSDSDDTIITFDGSCDEIVNQTCCMQREVGDVVTLSVKIHSSKKKDSFQVRWMKVYHIYESKKGKPLEIDPGKLPWNMVSGSEGRELRLNPVTNTDLDPNCIVAKVFLLTKNRGKTLFTQLKKLIFRIDSPIIDMGKIYAGEELSINIENFISLPEHGDLLLDWSLETKPHQYESLPSSIKVSNSGRTVVLKELKRGRMGVLNCVIYSSNRFAVAKKRFNILKVGDSVKRRSTAESLMDKLVLSDLKRKRRCRHVIRRSYQKAMKLIEEGERPISRKKRFRRVESDPERLKDMECERLRKRAYSRWVRSLIGEFTTEDPRLMSLEKLIELSEEGDGTLDDEIPHEVHYVFPQVKFLPGTSLERSRQLPFTANCTSNDDCGKDATCVTPEGQENSSGEMGYCNCRREFYGDGFKCHKIPLSTHREKRLKRNVNKDFMVPKHLFYERSKETLPVTTTEIIEEDEEDAELPKILAFEEEESFLLTECIDDKDCSVHANCVQPNNGHPYCKCRPGFRGNGIFCWETVDYVPPEEHFFAGDEIDARNPSASPDLTMNRLASRIPSSDELEET